VNPIEAAITGPLGTAALLMAAAGLTVLPIFLGVIVPAIWSRNSQRRRDAQAVLEQIVALVRTRTPGW
jgi:hypothetical protein